MTILSAQSIRANGLVTPCEDAARDPQGNSYGLSACGYDVRIDQDIMMYPGDFRLASTMERLTLPPGIAGFVHDKSSLARRGLALQNTVLEPGWRGYVTLELTNHSLQIIRLSRGDAVGQVVFHWLDAPTELPYNGKYQDQEPGPQKAR